MHQKKKAESLESEPLVSRKHLPFLVKFLIKLHDHFFVFGYKLIFFSESESKKKVNMETKKEKLLLCCTLLVNQCNATTYCLQQHRHIVPT